MSNLLRLLYAEDVGARLVLALILPSLIEAGLVALLQAASYADGPVDAPPFIAYLGLLGLFMVCEWQGCLVFSRIAETAVCKLRCRIADKTRRAPVAEEVRRLLAQLGIAERTAYTADGFTCLDLSTGQRKRLAMVVALLEDRPIFIFDEWAADQDPEFRRYYYEQLLPEMKRRGKTVLAISHDDRYFHCADRVVTLEYGAIRSITAPPPLQTDTRR